MIFYLLYRLGHFLAMRLPIRISYRMACALSDSQYYLSKRDRLAVIRNLKVALGQSYDDEKLERMAKEVFRNFAKYLVDFFRFDKVDLDYIKRFVKVEGLDNVDMALSKGKGAIMLSAHIGNWELGGFVLSVLKNPMGAVVLSHKNRKVNEFFTRQRRLSKLKPIEIGPSLRACYSILKDNGLLALLGDRDFSKNGIFIKFFGKETLMPKGPATLSTRIGSAIVPVFMIREPDDTFRLILERPIFPETSEEEDRAVRALTTRFLERIESYIRRYPTQWYVFREVWNDDLERDLRPDTII